MPEERRRWADEAVLERCREGDPGPVAVLRRRIGEARSWAGVFFLGVETGADSSERAVVTRFVVAVW